MTTQTNDDGQRAPEVSARTNAATLNRHVYISDNLPFLRSLDDESVDLVCIDPPFSKTQTFTGRIDPPLTDAEKQAETNLMESWGIHDATSAYMNGIEYPDQEGTSAKFDDIWSFPKHVYEDEWDHLADTSEPAARAINATRAVHGDSMAAYLTFMALRLVEAHRVLKTTGSIYLHCDHQANGYLRLLMDAVFGPANFRNEIVWRSVTNTGKGSQHAPKTWQNAVNSIFFYAKTAQSRVKPFRQPTEDELRAAFPKVLTVEAEDGTITEERYNTATPIARARSMGPRPNLYYEWQGVLPPHPSGWRVSKERMAELWEAGNVVKVDGRLERRSFARDYAGVPVGNLWADILPVQRPERTGYPTQKPQALARRIIESSTEPGDVVVDCFAGCAYVPVAAEQLGRRWIACDMSPRAYTVIRRQFHKQNGIRIITEGDLPAHPGDKAPAVAVGIDSAGKFVRVKGPHQLPERLSPSPPPKQRAVSTKRLPKPTYRRRPIESDDAIWNAFVEAWGPECWYCGNKMDADRRVLHLDHIEPNRRDGSNDDRSNRALACAPCNSDKGDRLSVQETVQMARDAGRIASDNARELVVDLFHRKHQWAQLTEPAVNGRARPQRVPHMHRGRAPSRRVRPRAGALIGD